MKRNFLAIVLAVIILLSVFALTAYLYELAHQEVVFQFQEHQLSHAQQLASEIRHFLESRSRDLKVLSSIIMDDNIPQKEAHLQAYSEDIKSIQIEVISLYDEDGIAIYSTNRDAIHLNYAQEGFFLSAKKKENKGKILIFPQYAERIQESNSFLFLLVIPQYQKSRQAARFVGALAFTVSLKKFLAQRLPLMEAEARIYQVWVMDREGTLLYQSEHPEMVFRNIYKRDESCVQCHISFDYVEEILGKRRGSIDYRLKNSPNKLASFAPVNFGDLSWVVVFNSHYDEVTLFTKKSLYGFLSLLGIVMMSLIGGFIFIRHNDRLRIKAQEETKYWYEKHSLEEKARQSEMLYQTVVETAHEVIWILDPQGNFSFINRSCEKICGHERPEKIGHSIFHLVHGGDLSIAQNVFSRTLGGETASQDLRFVAKGGKVFILSVNTTPLYGNGKVIGAIFFGRDVTEQKKTEKALQESEELHRITLTNISDAVFITNDEGAFTYICPNVDIIFGYTFGEVQALGNISYLVGSGLFDRAQLLASGEIRNIERELSDKSGRQHVLLINVKRVSIKGGTVLYTCRDISDRKEAEKELIESEERFRTLVETMNEGLGIQDENGILTYVNDRLCVMLQSSPEDILGHPVSEFVDKENQKMFAEQMTGRREGKQDPYEITWTQRDGGKVTTIVSPGTIFDKNGRFRGSFGVITDITEQKKNEEVLREYGRQLRYLSSQLLTAQEEERKRISGELHDELAGSLASLKLQMGHMRKTLPEGGKEGQEEYDEMLREIDRIVENMRRLSRDLGPYVLEHFGLSVALRRLFRDLTKESGIDVALDAIDINPSFLQGPPIILYRIFQEILNNIRKHAHARKVSVVIKEDIDQLSFLIEDDGQGFDTGQILMKDPAQKGLGLMIIQERVRMLGGSFSLWSQKWKGTRIHIVLPKKEGVLP